MKQHKSNTPDITGILFRRFMKRKKKYLFLAQYTYKRIHTAHEAAQFRDPLEMNEI